MENNLQDQNLLNEISAISGYSKVQIAEVWEYTALRVLESYLEAINDGTISGTIESYIPKIGKITTYKVNDIDKGSYTETQFKSTIELSSFLRTLITEGMTNETISLDKIFERKLNNSIVAITS